MADKRISLSPYQYCQNDPIIRFDPNGKIDWDKVNAAARKKKAELKKDIVKKDIKTHLKKSLVVKGSVNVAIGGKIKVGKYSISGEASAFKVEVTANTNLDVNIQASSGAGVKGTVGNTSVGLSKEVQYKNREESEAIGANIDIHDDDRPVTVTGISNQVENSNILQNTNMIGCEARVGFFGGGIYLDVKELGTALANSVKVVGGLLNMGVQTAIIKMTDSNVLLNSESK